jgi:hypothetical protein
MGTGSGLKVGRHRQWLDAVKNPRALGQYAEAEA